MLDANTCSTARLSRDARFDGKFYTAVLTTGIFCRPICPARAPKEENVRYFANAVAAQDAGFKPCKRCYPEQAPGQQLPIMLQKIVDTLTYQQTPIQQIAQDFQLSERHLRRIFIDHFGVPPSKFCHHQRLLFARKLLTTTQMTISDVCFSAGFSSIRRFNEAIKQSYGETPSQIRKRVLGSKTLSDISVLLGYRPPLDWQTMLDFFRQRQLTGVELVDENSYQRTINLDKSVGWIKVTHIEDKHALKLTVSLEDITQLNQVIARVRRMFDLDADMIKIHQHLAQDSLLKSVIQQYPGLRLPGCWDIFEFSIRAILGQQVSVKAATTMAARIAEQYGTKLPMAHHQLKLCFPTLSQLREVDYQGIGLTQSRIATLNTWVDFFQNQPKIFDQYTDLAKLLAELTQLKGIGPWTVNYIAMRGLSDPNAFPASDLGIIKALNLTNKTSDIKLIEQQASAWQPWRAYAAIYLWHSLK